MAIRDDLIKFADGELNIAKEHLSHVPKGTVELSCITATKADLARLHQSLARLAKILIDGRST